MKTNKFKNLAVIAMLFLIGGMNVLAQGPSGQTPPPNINPPGDTDPVESSIDQAMIWLLVAGVFVALYFLQAKKAAKAAK